MSPENLEKANAAADVILADFEIVPNDISEEESEDIISNNPEECL
jgi:hypothetical protein